jgi:hypothetical protein
MLSHSFECVQQSNEQIKKTKSKKNLICICGTKTKGFKICSDCYMNHRDNPNYESAKFASQLGKKLG